MKLTFTDKILIEGIAAIIEALGMIAENQTRAPNAPWGAMWFNEAAGIFRNRVELAMLVKEEKHE